MKNHEQHWTRPAELESLEQDLTQCLHDVANAVSQQRPLRLAFFISQLNAFARDYFAAEDSSMRAWNSAGLTARLAERDGLRSQFVALQQHAIHGTLDGNLVDEFRCGLTEYLLHTHMRDSDTNGAPDNRRILIARILQGAETACG